ncbi:MAG: ferrous iron transport protein B [Spirosomaceae bacterium]|nr:ferrous iron transport protein B [Spirosomataceae bacterium]
MKIALVGNPNSGKSSLFNQLTGLRQKVGNFPGVTVDKKSGQFKLADNQVCTLIDFPGTYSIHPKSEDERVVLEVFTNPESVDYPDLAIVVADASNLKRSLLLFEQISDLNIPTVVALNQLDTAQQKRITLNSSKLSRILGVPVVEINAREKIGIDGLKLVVAEQLKHKKTHQNLSFLSEEAEVLADTIRKEFSVSNRYVALLQAIHSDKLSFLSPEKKRLLQEKIGNFNGKKFQSDEVMSRYADIAETLDEVVIEEEAPPQTLSQKLDDILLHRTFGYFIFAAILLLMFQAVFTLAEYPMDFIDSSFGSMIELLKERLPESQLTDLFTDGLLAGIAGVVIFIPQIAFLFAFIAILEESGYMARVVVLMDKLIRGFGLSGRSVVPLISGIGCAIPAIMAARTIGGWKERLITIMVTPLMSCAARLPIYTILIALVVPNEPVLGFFTTQGFALMGLYLIGFIFALLSSWVMSLLMKSSHRSMFVMELPTYQLPRWRSILFTIYEKVLAFVWGAGKVIVAISIVLWVMASYGPGNSLQEAEERVIAENTELPEAQLENKIAAAKLQNSYAGMFGKIIEPTIAPLGYDWKIGIALIASFAAREVFVGTISTIYSIGADAEDRTIKARLRNEKKPNGEPVFTVATSMSLLVFYVFAMMCMSTLAVVYRETKSWKWPIIQFVYMTALAYISAWGVFQFLS